MEPGSRAVSGGRSATEEAIAGIWAEVLRLPHVEVDANFFDIGGDSLKAMDVIVRLGEALGVEMPLMAFFEDPTVAHLAAVADELRGGDTAAAPLITRVLGRREFRFRTRSRCSGCWRSRTAALGCTLPPGYSVCKATLTPTS